MAEYHPLRTEDHDPTTSSYAELNAQAESRARECKIASVPNLSHVKLSDYESVYEPSDDTYLLLDAIGLDVDLGIYDGGGGGGAWGGKLQEEEEEEGGGGGEGRRRRHRRDDELERGDGGPERHDDVNNVNDDDDDVETITTLEIGCGTGVPTVYLGMRLREEDENTSRRRRRRRRVITHHVTDVNPNAIRIANLTAMRNGIPPSEFRARVCDLASDVINELDDGGGVVDVLIFNPPYVPTPNDEVGRDDGITACWAGGINGRVVLDRALPQLARLLSYPNGVAYVVVVDDNYPEEISRLMYERYGIVVIPWLRRRARNEYLTILRMTTTREYNMHRE
ncbi:hypothetical protein ACHAXA_008173 [Cyclostephanos tholiformis]|uniref:Uncharacterized protein n=1 Tax=Cyclostephanos tholiformis TaxID=382380 RepID=A0ABD3RCI2_9STRA